MLAVLGLDEQAESVYRLMLTRRQWGVAEFADHLGLSEHDVRRALDRLAELRLLRESAQAQGALRPVSPKVGLGMLLQRQEDALLRWQQQLAEGQEAALRLADELSDSGGEDGSHGVELLEGLDAIQMRLEELAHGCSSECLSLMPGGAQSAVSLEASRPLDEALMARGVSVLTLYQDSVRNDRPTLTYARWLTEHGGEVRTAAVLPVRMVMFDRRVALLPVDPENTKRGALQVTGPGLVGPLVQLFDQTWSRSAPFGTPRDGESGEGEPTKQEAALLGLLAQGLTDELAARRLGLGVRTVRRTMADLMGRLGARSRFEAGVRAARREWVD
ncbi:LuxR C-terminal-related transcriptional regulator [Streptomyces sp. NPDC058476]|uniref:LuxR C-terminal-related transcriptional regulator n=1 Tax=Streptomyces sp. NPDC058476 TaxID=3346519 RepID=UPI003648DFFB